MLPDKINTISKRIIRILHKGFFSLILILSFSFPGFTQEDCIDSLMIDTVQYNRNCWLFEEPLLMHFYNPVCGCDSTTYFDEYCGRLSGVTRFEPGPCRCYEPGFIDTSRTLMYYVISNSAGDPVLGCDGKVYLSPDMALRYGGVTSFSRENVPYFDSSYINLDLDLSAFPDKPVCGWDKKNYRNKFEAVFYGGILKWVNMPCECIIPSKIDTTVECEDVYEPVCGCDRVTYKNACIAEYHHGVQYFRPGECPCIDETLILNDSIFYSNITYAVLVFGYFHHPVCGCDSVTYANEVIAQYRFGVTKWTKGACICVDSTQIDPDVSCIELFSPVVGCDGKVYRNSCIARYRHGVMEYYRPDCIEPGLIDTTVECHPVFNYSPVCGCDEITYPNQCYAINHAGVAYIRHTGECEDDTTCYDPFLINPLKYCSNQYFPVCGCDGVTYTNECVAKHRYGMRRWTQGPCDTTSTIETDAYNAAISVFPNPFSHSLHFNFAPGETPDFIEIYNATGNMLAGLNIEPDQRSVFYDTMDFPSGLYFILTSTKNVKRVNKVVKQ